MSDGDSRDLAVGVAIKETTEVEGAAHLAERAGARDLLLQRYHDERRRADRAEQLCRVVNALNADLNVGRQLATLQRRILQLTGLSACWVALFDEETGTVILRDEADQEQVRPARLPQQGRVSAAPATMFEALFIEGSPILTDDYLDECRRRNLRPVGPLADRPGCAWFGMPLRVGERVIGALATWSLDGPIDAEVVELLQALAEQGATALDNARRYALAEQRHREEATFNAIARDLAASLDGKTIFDHIARHTRNLLGCDAALIALYDPATDHLHVRGFNSDAAQAAVTQVDSSEGLTGYIWRTGQPLIADDYPNDERFVPPAQIRDDPTLRTWVSSLGVPITLNGERLGVLQASTRARRRFTARDEAILERLATQAALAVRNARLFAAERARAARAEALREIGRDLSANLDLAGLLDSLRQHLRQLTGLGNCWVGLCDEAHGAQISLWVDDGERRPEAEGTLPLPLPPSMFREIVREGRSILTDDYVRECEQRGIPTAGFHADKPNRSWLGLPLQVGGRTIGAMAVWRWDGAIEAEVVTTLETLTGQIATALENARLYDIAERQRREETAFNAIARDLAASLDGDVLLQRLGEHTRALLDVTAARLTLYDEATGLLKVVAGSGGDTERFIGFTSTPEVGMSGLVWRTRQPFSTSNYSGDERFSHIPDFDEWSEEQGMQSVLGVPILLGDQPLGVLAAITDEQRAFTVRDELVLARLATQAALAVHNARLFAEAHERAARLEVLNDIAHQLSAEIDFERFLLSIWRHVGRISPVDGCWIALWHEKADELQFCLYIEDGVRNAAWELSLARAAGEGLAWAVLSEQTLLRVADYNAECRRRGLTPKGSDAERSRMPWLGIPLIVNGRTIGAMALWRRERAFADEEATTFGTLANQIAATLENARLYQEARTLAVTDPLTGLLNHRTMQERLDQEFARAARHGRPLAVVMIDLDKFKLFNDTYGHPAGDQILRATAAILRAEARDADILARYGGDEFCLILPDTTHEGALALVERVQAHCRSVGIQAEQSQMSGDQSGGTIPLRVSAGIAVYPRDAKDRHELVTRADMALYANKRGGRPLATLDCAMDEATGMALISNASFGVIEGLVLAVDAKDQYTVAHSQVVADAAVLLARALHLPEREVAILRAAGLLHDVGKVSLPGRILRKPGRLTRAERRVMRQHVAFGALIIRGVPGLRDILVPVMHHHERWDGRGYPRGLAGAAVPLLGRILIVADAYGAMTLDRPYRRGLGVPAALAELRAGAGTQFDPDLVALLCDVIAQEELQRIVDLATQA